MIDDIKHIIFCCSDISLFLHKLKNIYILKLHFIFWLLLHIEMPVWSDYRLSVSVCVFSGRNSGRTSDISGHKTELSGQTYLKYRKTSG